MHTTGQFSLHDDHFGALHDNKLPHDNLRGNINIMKTTRRQIIHEVAYGMWVWQMADGEYAEDDNGNFMHVFVWDVRDEAVNEAAKKALATAAKSYGFGEGRPICWQGRRPVDDEGFMEQYRRMQQGLVPDPLDIAAIREEERQLKNSARFK
jgi:hypothetical protein